jgi:hypothetical protein
MVDVAVCRGSVVSRCRSLLSSPSSSILSERSVKEKGRAISEDGGIEMAEARDKSVCKKTKSVSLAFLCSFSDSYYF